MRVEKNYTLPTLVLNIQKCKSTLSFSKNDVDVIKGRSSRTIKGKVLSTFALVVSSEHGHNKTGHVCGTY